MNDTKTYMETVSGSFSAHELYFSVHHKSIHEDGKITFSGKAFKQIDLAISEAYYWTKKGHDVYVGMGGQQDVIEQERTSHNGRKYNVNKAIRKRYNITKCSSLYIDLDVKEGGYASTNDATIALKEFIKKYNLPVPTMMVLSGTGGLHSYWVSDELFSPDEFFGMAFALTNMGQEFGLKFDQQCTNDICRLLRPPQTWNFKTDPPLPVKLYYSGSKVPLETLKTKFYANGYVYNPVEGAPDDNDELSTPRKEYELVDIDKVAEVCPFIKNTLATGGKDQSEPIWKVAVTLASYCVDGRNLAHKLSSGHEAYSPEETNFKYDQGEVDKEHNSRLGPTKCSVIHNYGATECNTCPNLHLNKSPINIPVFTKKPNSTNSTNNAPANDLPEGYSRDKRNHIFHVTEGENPSEIFNYPIIPGSAFAEGGDKEYQLVFTTREGDGREKIIKIPMTTSSDRTSLSIGLAKNGLPIMTTEATRRFMTSFMSQLRSNDRTLILTSPLGWHTLPGRGTGFSYNGVCYFKGTNLKAQRLDGDFAKHYSVQGSAQAWRDLADLIILQNRPEINTIIAASFAAPLMEFTGHNGCAIGIWSSGTGVGKSTGLSIGQAIWGSTIRMSGLSDTLNQTIDTMATLKNIVQCWDELKGQKQIEQFAQIIFELSRGREKGRLDKLSHQLPQREFQTLLAWTANQPLADEIARRVRGTAAGNYRMLEFNIDEHFRSNLSVTQVSALVGELRKNYGHVGERYAKYLGQNYETLRHVIPKIRDHFEDILKATQAERYWVSMAACIYSGARIANQLSITRFDLPSMKDFLIKTIDYSRSNFGKIGSNDLSKKNDMTLILGEMLSFFSQQTIKTDIMAPHSAGRPKRGAVRVLNDNGNLTRTSIVLQISRSPVLCRVTDPALGRWCKEQGMPKSAFINALQRFYQAKYTRSRIGSGTDYVSPPLLVWELNFMGTSLEQEIEF